MKIECVPNETNFTFLQFLDEISMSLLFPITALRNKARMASYVTNTPAGVLFEKDTLQESIVTETLKEKYKVRIVWRNVIVMMYLHLAALYGVYLLFTSAKLMTAAFGERH